MNNEVLMGIDLSLTSPAICIHTGRNVTFESCSLFYLTDKKKRIGKFGNIVGVPFKPYSCDEERYNGISEFIIERVKEYGVTKVYIEDYAFAATGRVFNIAENCGLLKYKLWKMNIPIVLIPPTVAKKYASGRGNADKLALDIAFKRNIGIDIKAILGVGVSSWNPSSDLIDAYNMLTTGIFSDAHPEILVKAKKKKK